MSVSGLAVGYSSIQIAGYYKAYKGIVVSVFTLNPNSLKVVIREI
jgi:hypothetical protein